MASEKSQPQVFQPEPRKPGNLKKSLLAFSAAATISLLGLTHQNTIPFKFFSPSVVISQSKCVSQPVFRPETRPDITKRNVEELFTSGEFSKLTAERLSGAVQIPTQMFDDMGSLEGDERWEIFYKLAKYFNTTFPLVHKNLDLKTINRHGLLYTWKGSDPSLKPLLFLGHQDVVPVNPESLNRWTHPPFSGLIDEKYVWGRGSQDDKSCVTTIFSALEALVEAKFEPTRTILLSLGFDEEGGGAKKYGAKSLSEYILETYGPKGIEIIIDEGATIQKVWGVEFATPSTGEKGVVNVAIDIATDGGHSSIPPDHTGIGYLSKIITTIEENPFESRIDQKNPYINGLTCLAEYAPDVPEDLRTAILNPGSSNDLLEYLDSNLNSRALIRTTAAVDIISGGVKANALPETVSALVNHRIATHQTIATVAQKYKDLVLPLSTKWGFDLSVFGQNFTSPSCASAKRGLITITNLGGIDPAPLTDVEDARFSWVAGALRGTFGKDLVVGPGMMTGNTDTAFYWESSDQIYRFAPRRDSLDPEPSHIHTINERASIEALVEMVRFYHEFIRIVDEKRV